MIPYLLLGLLGLLALAVTVLLFPSPFARLLSHQRIEWPVPPGVYLRGFPHLLWLLLNTPSATTFGTTIYIQADRWAIGNAEWRARLIAHELVHVEQSKRYGVLYLPRYILLWIRHGYINHPMEIEARERT